MSSKNELISGDWSAADDKLFVGEGDANTLPSPTEKGFCSRDEPAIATASSSFNDSKLCVASICGKTNNKAWNTSVKNQIINMSNNCRKLLLSLVLLARGNSLELNKVKNNSYRILFYRIATEGIRYARDLADLSLEMYTISSISRSPRYLRSEIPRCAYCH